MVDRPESDDRAALGPVTIRSGLVHPCCLGTAARAVRQPPGRPPTSHPGRVVVEPAQMKKPSKPRLLSARAVGGRGTGISSRTYISSGHQLATGSLLHDVPGRHGDPDERQAIARGEGRRAEQAIAIRNQDARVYRAGTSSVSAPGPISSRRCCRCGDARGQRPVPRTRSAASACLAAATSLVPELNGLRGPTRSTRRRSVRLFPYGKHFSVQGDERHRTAYSTSRRTPAWNVGVEQPDQSNAGRSSCPPAASGGRRGHDGQPERGVVQRQCWSAVMHLVGWLPTPAGSMSNSLASRITSSRRSAWRSRLSGRPTNSTPTRTTTSMSRSSPPPRPASNRLLAFPIAHVRPRRPPRRLRDRRQERPERRVHPRPRRPGHERAADPGASATRV